MELSKHAVGWVFFLLILSAVGFAVSNVYTDYNFNNHSIMNLTNVNSTFLSGNLSWSNLTNYPTACPTNSAVTALGDSATCTDSWVDSTGANMTGNLNATGYNLSAQCVIFDSGGSICSGS